MSAVFKGFTLTQYLAHELKTGEKHEYHRGEIFAMVAGTPRQSHIATNFSGEPVGISIPLAEVYRNVKFDT
jgi:quercetin dioxygenase-like cupin family protein